MSTKPEKTAQNLRNDGSWQRVAALRAMATSDCESLAVDREKGIVYGAVMAQMGPFKSEGRGEFDETSLEIIKRLAAAAPNGLKARFSHPNESDDGIGNFLGRWKNPRLSSVGRRESEGELRTDIIPAVRGDFYFDSSASITPRGDLRAYLLERIASDPDSLSTSLVLQADREFRVDKFGIPLKDADGDELPPLWRPTRLHACDVVDTGDAVDSILSAAGVDVEALSNGVLWQADEALNKHFAGKDRAFVEVHLTAYLRRYLDRRYGELDGGMPMPKMPDAECMTCHLTITDGKCSKCGMADQPMPDDPANIPPSGLAAEQEAALQRIAEALKP